MNTSGTEGQNKSVPVDKDGVLLSNELLVSFQHPICLKKKIFLSVSIIEILEFQILSSEHFISKLVDLRLHHTVKYNCII